MRRILCCLLVIFSLLGLTMPASSDSSSLHGVWPLEGDVGREFTELTHNWESGHRGLDIRGNPGVAVRSALPGTVSFVGKIAGRDVISVSHGDLRTTYEPVAATVVVGDYVPLGGTIGTLADALPQCGNPRVLHWGLKRGDAYLNPRILLAPRRARLVPWDWVPPAPPAPPVADDVDWGRPPGQVTSQFGYRVDPVTGQPSFHSGTDFGHACGQPIVALAPGTVSFAGWSTLGYGNLVEVSHPRRDGRRISTRYGHAEALLVHEGQSVQAGETVALTGSTGHSTGCHLHLEVLVDGTPVDPLTWLPTGARR